MSYRCKEKNLKLEIKKNEFQKYYPNLRQNKNEFGGGESVCLLLKV